MFFIEIIKVDFVFCCSCTFLFCCPCLKLNNSDICTETVLLHHGKILSEWCCPPPTNYLPIKETSKLHSRKGSG